jgi:hypothetical protein
MSDDRLWHEDGQDIPISPYLDRYRAWTPGERAAESAALGREIASLTKRLRQLCRERAAINLVELGPGLVTR